jgi:hypothetical protein
MSSLSESHALLTGREVVRFPGSTRVPRNAVCEIEFLASCDFNDPWAEIELDVEFTDPDGDARLVPAFWAGGRAWCVRYSSLIEGVHRYRSIVRGPETGLEGIEGEITVTRYAGSNPLLLHGAPTVGADGRHLAHADSEPFLWLADTWWSAMTARFRWPDTFQTLADDRARKGFSVIQLVAGLPPEFVPFSPDMASEGGQPWLDGGAGRINPAYYSIPDLKIDYLVGKGLAPCIVGGWAYFTDLLGRERIMRHWRHLVARYAAYPVVWCIAGETDLLSRHGTNPPRRSGDLERAINQVAIWEDASKLVGAIDPFHRIRTVHPTPAPPTNSYSSSDVFESPDSFELDMLQTGHLGRECVPATMEHLHASLARGDKPVLNGECCYEGIFDSCWHDLQRFLFWSHMLSGAAGHTYGTMAISSINSKDDPLVPQSRVSVHYWEDAIDWRGSAHVAVGKRILERLPWWRLRPRPGAIEPHAGPDDWFLPYAAEFPGGTLVVYFPSLAMASKNDWSHFARWTLNGLLPDAGYRATYIDPRSGEEAPSHSFSFRASRGAHTVETGYLWNTPTGEDWVLFVSPED